MIGWRGLRRLAVAAAVGALWGCAHGTSAASPPYGPSPLVTGPTFNKQTFRSGGIGGDLWPMTTGPKGQLYTAWGDGVVGCPQKVAYGVGIIGGGPNTNVRPVLCGPTNLKSGKITSLLSVGATLWATAYLQDRPDPGATVQVWRSTNSGRSFDRAGPRFAGSSLRPAAFVNVGQGGVGRTSPYVYLTAFRPIDAATATGAYLMRVPYGQLYDRSAYQYFSGTASSPAWSGDEARARGIFTDPAKGVDGAEIVWNAGLGRYLLTVAHGHAGQVGIFEAPEPWGPWKTVYYTENWLAITGGEYLNIRFPIAWMDPSGLSMWATFSCYGCSGTYNDRLNLLQFRLQRR